MPAARVEIAVPFPPELFAPAPLFDEITQPIVLAPQPERRPDLNSTALAEVARGEERARYS
jgi:hypothetical protein